MTDFLSIADAARLTGRHEKTIRRWVKKQLDSDPQAREKIVQEKTVSGFTYRIDKNYLLTHSPTNVDSPPVQSTERPPGQGTEQATGQGTPLPDPVIAAKDETITLLKEQIQQQQEELRRKNEQLKTVLERLGEQNVLLQGYHSRYLLPAAGGREEFDITVPHGREGVDVTVDNTPEQGDRQGAVRTPRQGRRANPTDLDTKGGQNEQPEKQNEVKPSRKPLFKRSKPPKKLGQEQPKKKGFFSFLRGK